MIASAESLGLFHIGHTVAYELYQRADRDGWWFRFTHPVTGRRCQRKAGDAIKEARRTADEYARRISLFRDGLITPQQVQRAQEGQRPILDIMHSFRLHLEGRHVTDRHIQSTVACVERIIAKSGVTCLDDINESKIGPALSSLTKGLSGSGANRYLASIRQLTRWATRQGIYPADPLAALQRRRESNERPIRALTNAESDALVARTQDAYRATVYRFALRTGLRWSEMRSLLWCDIDWSRGWLVLNPERTKARRGDELPLSPDVLKALRDLGPGMPHGKVFPTLPTRLTFQRDLKRCGIDESTDHGQACRKSLRKTFITHLLAGGEHPRVVQALARHTDIRLTTKHYTDVHLLDLAGAVGRLSGSNQKSQERTA